MNIGFKSAKLYLGAREVLRLYDTKGARVECLEGALWITQARDFEDHFLAANDAFTLDRHGLALIHAQRPSSIVIVDSAPRAGLRARIGHALAASARAAGRWLASTFGPESIDLKRNRGWHHGL